MKTLTRATRLVYILLGVFALCLIAICAFSQTAHAAKMYWATTLTGGGDALDGIDGATLAAGDAATVILDSSGAPRFYLYRAYASGTAASSPLVIAPATNPGTMRWHLAQRSEQVDALSIGAGGVSNTKFSYLSDVTSLIQAQINGKASSSHNHAAGDVNSGTFPVARGGTNSGTALNNYRVIVSVGGGIIEHSALTAARVLYTDANGLPAVSGVTATELGYLANVTSAIQTQLNAKAGKTGIPTAGHIASWADANTIQDGGALRTDNSTASHIPYINSAGAIADLVMGAGITETGGTLAVIYGVGTPNMDGTGAVGTANSAARSDHVHPTDTSRQAALTLLAGGAKVPTTDIAAPGTPKCAEWDANGKLVVAGSNAACGSGGSGADASGYYLVSRTTNAPANAVNLGALSTGWFKITVAGGVATPSTGNPTASDVGLGNVDNTSDATKNSATKTLTNTTYDSAGTGNVLKQTKYLVLSHPDRCDGTGATMDTTGTNDTFGHCTFSASAAYTANTAYYELTVPADIDTAVDLTAQWQFSLGGADTNAHCYKIEMADVADSAARAGSFTNTVNLPKAGDASGASGDIETVSATTLTSWKTSLTAGHLLRIRIGRDGGNEGTSCAAGAGSSVASYSGPLVISYGSTQ